MRKKKEITSRETHILEMWSEGVTLQAIADHWDVSRERIRQILGRLSKRGYTVASRGERSRAKSQRKIEHGLTYKSEVLSCLNQGQSAVDISRSLGINSTQTRFVIRQLVREGKTFGAKYVPRESTLSMWKIIQGSLREQKALGEIAEQLGISKRGVTHHIRLMRENGVLAPQVKGPRPNELLDRRREQIIRQMIAEGAKRSQIADALGISVGTLGRLVAHIRMRQE